MDAGENVTKVQSRLPYDRIGGLGWAHLLNDGAANLLPGVLPAILLQLDLSVGLAGSIMAALLIGQGLQPFVGLLADRLGGRALIAVGLFGSSLGSALIGWIDSVPLLVAVLILIGVSNSLFHPQALASVRRLAHTNQGSVMSFFLVGGEIGRGVWPVAASWIVVSLGRSSLWLLALPALLTLPFLLRWAPVLPARRRDATPIAWRRHTGPLSLLVGFCTLRALMTFALVTYMPLIWTQAGGSMTTGASLITVFLVVGVIGNLAGGWISDRFGTRPILGVSMITSTVLLVVFTQVSGIWLWIACGALGIMLFATFPLTILIVQDILPENRSFGSGLALGLANAFGAVGIMIIGPTAQHWGAVAPLWIAAAGGVVATVLVARMPGRAAA